MGAALALSDLPAWPAALTWDEALAYTGVAEAQMRVWAKAGRVQFRARGPKGARLALRSSLDAALIDLFSAAVDEDMDFGD